MGGGGKGGEGAVGGEERVIDVKRSAEVEGRLRWWEGWGGVWRRCGDGKEQCRDVECRGGGEES